MTTTKEKSSLLGAWHMANIKEKSYLWEAWHMATTKEQSSPLRTYHMTTTLLRIKEQEALNLPEQATPCVCWIWS